MEPGIGLPPPGFSISPNTLLLSSSDLGPIP